VTTETFLNPFAPSGDDTTAPKREPAEIRAEMTEITPDIAREWIRRHEAVVSVFLERLLDGADLPHDHPVLALRNRMINAKIPPVERSMSSSPCSASRGTRSATTGACHAYSSPPAG
jgi:hypothetical protein